MKTSSWRTRASALLVAVGLSIAAAGTASAGNGGGDDGPLRDRLHLACQRIPIVQARVDAAITHLTAGADIKGSIAWVEAKIATAQANNHPRIVADLQARLAIMQDRLAIVQDRQTRLATLAERCAELGEPV